MSYQKTDYLILGWKIPNDMKDQDGIEIDLWDDKYLPYIEGHQGIDHSLIVDSVGDKLHAFGLNLGSLEEYDNKVIEVPIELILSKVIETKKLYQELFNLNHVPEPQLILISHYL